MLLVIWVHAENLHLALPGKASGALYGAVAWIEELMSDKLGQIAVPGFFFISGYLFVRSFEGRRIGLTQIKDKWMNRLRSLVLPYVIWNLIYYAIYLAFGRAELSDFILVVFAIGFPRTEIGRSIQITQVTESSIRPQPMFVAGKKFQELLRQEQLSTDAYQCT